MSGESRVLELALVSHRGRVREHNEDSAGLAGWVLTSTDGAPISLRLPLDVPRDLVVADGLGGHRGGARASREAIAAYFAGGEDPQEAARFANSEVYRLATIEPMLLGMGTTIVVARFDPQGTLTIVNVGDSRAYWLQDGYLGRLSKDDRPENAPPGIVTQVLGGDRPTLIEPHRYDAPIAPGVPVLVCSDGVHDVVDDDDIATALALEPVAAVMRLLDLALDAGAPDNVTAIVARVIEPELRVPDPPSPARDVAAPDEVEVIASDE